METLTLQRQPSTDQGTFGQLFRNGKQLCVTCEPVSPIPAGTYTCMPHSGPKFKNVWELQDVPGHTNILIHNGNTIKDSTGCILVGNTYGRVDDLPAVVNSRLMLETLRLSLPRTFAIAITDASAPGSPVLD